ncbi:conserved Plasmodium protein, unknown function [Plasmodium berghei ANKA]|uniref:Uncharacterized protein n=1 Tax=Plasmodium berghei (strain Anka) TaxID=5823 RepID=A0A509AK60_PLABA|nr:conserved Plasmodium protein, unknown function [Plasmodium berghei ANKA]VUC55025.1 conserved Plasmodium protein, unknown function [Plasmodium berghei ANKA]|eukprot:XP_034420844.1 conserved Plasmodium protein, unknown function [Plasmodium berghei ANKA]
MTNITYRIKGSFIYNDELKVICMKIVILSKNLYKYRKIYIKYAKNVELEQSKKDIININIDKSRKTFNNKNNKDISNLSFYNLIRQYDELINNLVNLYNNHIDIYIEFLYILIINSNLFNYFLYICTFYSGNEYDSFLSLIHKHFIILIKYYYYSNYYIYYNYLYTKFKDIYDVPLPGPSSDSPKKGTHNATGSASDGDFFYENSNESDEKLNYEKKCNDTIDLYMSLSSENSFSNIKNNDPKKIDIKICPNPIKNKDIDKHYLFKINKKYFNKKKYFKLKKMMLMFEKLTSEHLYILLYFSLSILPTIFHTYLTLKFSKNNKHVQINSYLIYILRQIKCEITNTLKLKTKKKYFNKFTNSNDNLLYTFKSENDHKKIISDFVKYPINNTNKFKSNIQNNHEKYSDCFLKEKKKSNKILWSCINNINVNTQIEQINKFTKNEKCENYISRIKNKMKMLHTFEHQADLMILQNGNKEQSKQNGNKEQSKQNGNKEQSKQNGNKEQSKQNGNKEQSKQNGNKEQSKIVNGTDIENGEKDKSMIMLEQLLKDNMKINYIYKHIKKKKYIYNYKGFENIIKSVSIIIQYNIYSFFINQIGISNCVGKNNSIISNYNIYCENKNNNYNNCHISQMGYEIYENNNYIIVPEVKKDNALIHNEYIKKKIKKNKIYTYKMLNNKIEALINTKEFMENIKKEKQNKKKGNKYEKDKKNKLDFFYIGAENNNDCKIINNQNNIYDDISKYFKKKTNTDILESDIDSYKNSSSSENLIFYDNSKEYFYKNKLNIDYFTYFITTSFYIFIHFHNVYFSSTFFNIFITFSIKLAYKYTHKSHNTNYISPFLPLWIEFGKQPKKTKLNNKRFYRNIKKDEVILENVPLVKIPMNRFLQKYQNIKKKWHKFGYWKNDDYFTNKKSLSNTFEIIVNTFLDLCISLCSIDFKCINIKHNFLNKKYILNNIYYYNKIISKGYDEIELYNHDLQNYNNLLNGYLLYFSELKKSELFKNTFINNKQIRKKTNENVSKEKLNNCKLKESDKLYQIPYLERYHINMDKENKTIKKFIEKEFVYDQTYNDNEQDIYSSNCDVSLSNYSDKSLLFLKKCKNKINKRIYIDENNIINLLMNIGCLFMNNIKYNSRFVFKILDKMKKNMEISKNKDKFFNYMQTVFFSVYNNNNVEKKKKKKNSPFLNIYNQYLLSFFFFFKIHYIFFLIKLKSEKELYIRAYWLLYAVYNITQEF